MSRLTVLAVGILMLAGCGSCDSSTTPTLPGHSANVNVQGIPYEAPYIQGFITRLKDQQILVEENVSEVSGSAKASLMLTDSTRILRHFGEVVGVSDLRIGQRVRVWVVGPILESYPTQAVAAMIVIEA